MQPAILANYMDSNNIIQTQVSLPRSTTGESLEMNAWTVLINSLIDKPENYDTPPRQRTDPRPDVLARMAKLKGASEAEVLKVIKGMKGTATAADIREFLLHRSYKYICALCRRLELEDRKSVV